MADQVYRLIVASVIDVRNNANHSESFGIQFRRRFNELLSPDSPDYDEMMGIFQHYYNVMSATLGVDLEKENIETELAYAPDFGNLYGHIQNGYGALFSKIENE